jgi:triosephosphate isomerase
MSSQKIIVANWKLDRSLSQAVAWTLLHQNDLSELAARVRLIICPDIVTTVSLGRLLSGTAVFLGAQGCSPYLSGRHTGSISAQSLHEAGCSYAIIGHHEQRIETALTEFDYAISCSVSLQAGINPILCIGEQSRNFSEEQLVQSTFCPTLEALNNQFDLGDCTDTRGILYIAYEPIWTIGSKVIPTKKELQARITILKEIIDRYRTLPKVGILYGGGITSENCGWLRELVGLDGLMLGSSSLDMQSLKNIVYSFTK